MVFSFQTPCSEYAQALVDFHHYVFFFFIVVTIFVVWMLKFSLLFVVQEKNLSFLKSQVDSDFKWDRTSLWFKKDGEMAFLLWQFSLKIYGGLVSPTTRVTLAYYWQYVTMYIPFLFFFIKFFQVALSYPRFFFYQLDKSFFGGDTSSLNTCVPQLSTGYFLASLLKEKTKWDSILYKINCVGSKFYRWSENLFEVDGNLGGLNSTLVSADSSKLLSGVSKDTYSFAFLSLFVISSIREGLKATRFSHWSHSGKLKPVFLFYTGVGENYYLDRSQLSGFDLNLYMPQSFFFFEFYTVDLWENPFLFFQNVRHRLVLEWVWTFIPTVILLVLVVPSLYLLYSYDRPYVTAPYLTFKAIGHQWYWSYEYFDYIHSEGGLVAFDSYMVHEEELEFGQLRLLEVDRRVVLPTGVCVRMLTTSSDVLHSWAVPALGVKLDAVPGRLNQFWLVLNKPGVFYGQCSEICGVNHGFMPIAVEAVYLDQYLEFILTYNE